MSIKELVAKCKELVDSKDDQEHLAEELVLYIIESYSKYNDVDSEHDTIDGNGDIDDIDDEAFEQTVKRSRRIVLNIP